MINVIITGRDIHERMRLPAVPRRGDHLWLSSLVGRGDVLDVIVSKVEWARDQTVRYTDREHEGVHVWLTVRRAALTKPDPEP